MKKISKPQSKTESRGSVKFSKLLMVGILLGGGIAGPLQAGEFAYGLGYVPTVDDNITRVPTDKLSDTIHSVLAGFAYQEYTADLVAHVLAQAEYDHYQESTFDNQSLYYLDSSAVWTISPKRFFWTLEDAARQALIDSTVADTPTNRTQINVLDTGPDFFLRFSPVHSMALHARVGDVYTGRANVDSKRVHPLVSWLYEATSMTTYSLNYEALDVKYNDSTINDDFKRQDVFARAEYRASRTRYTLDLGTSSVNRDRGDDLSDSLVRLILTHELTTESSFGISANHGLSDTGSDILAESRVLTTTPVTMGSITPSTVLSSALITSDVYLAKRGDIFYTLHSSQIGVSLDASQRKFDFQTIPSTGDRKETDGRMEITYFFSATTTASLIADYTKTEYLDFFRRDTDRDFGFRLDYRLSPRTSLELEGHRYDRISTDPLMEFVDNRVFLSVLYSSGPLFTPVHGR